MHEPVLVPDMTIFIQVGIFFACYFVLNALVFKPYLALLKARREQTVGLREAAERDRAQAEKLRTEYETFLKTERKKISAWSDEERKKIQDEERHRIQLARDMAAKANDAARAVLEEEKDKARRDLESSASEFTSAIVSKMLGRKVQVSGGASQNSDVESTVPT
jgi:F-type H+-transporting ATPase subunit b